MGSTQRRRAGKGGRGTSIDAHAGSAVPTRSGSICRETSRGHGAKSAFAHPTRSIVCGVWVPGFAGTTLWMGHRQNNVLLD